MGGGHWSGRHSPSGVVVCARSQRPEPEREGLVRWAGFCGVLFWSLLAGICQLSASCFAISWLEQFQYSRVAHALDKFLIPNRPNARCDFAVLVASEINSTAKATRFMDDPPGERISGRAEMKADEEGQTDNLARDRPPSNRNSRSVGLRSSGTLLSSDPPSARGSVKDKLAHFHRVSKNSPKASPRTSSTQLKQDGRRQSVSRRSPFNLASLAEKHAHVAEAHPSWRDKHPSWRGPTPLRTSPEQALERVDEDGTATSIKPVAALKPYATEQLSPEKMETFGVGGPRKTGGAYRLAASQNTTEAPVPEPKPKPQRLSPNLSCVMNLPGDAQSYEVNGRIDSETRTALSEAEAQAEREAAELERHIAELEASLAAVEEAEEQPAPVPEPKAKATISHPVVPTPGVKLHGAHSMQFRPKKDANKSLAPPPETEDETPLLGKVPLRSDERRARRLAAHKAYATYLAGDGIYESDYSQKATALFAGAFASLVTAEILKLSDFHVTAVYLLSLLIPLGVIAALWPTNNYAARNVTKFWVYRAKHWLYRVRQKMPEHHAKHVYVSDAVMHDVHSHWAHEEIHSDEIHARKSVMMTQWVRLRYNMHRVETIMLFRYIIPCWVILSYWGSVLMELVMGTTAMGEASELWWQLHDSAHFIAVVFLFVCVLVQICDMLWWLLGILRRKMPAADALIGPPLDKLHTRFINSVTAGGGPVDYVISNVKRLQELHEDSFKEVFAWMRHEYIVGRMERWVALGQPPPQKRWMLLLTKAWSQTWNFVAVCTRPVTAVFLEYGVMMRRSPMKSIVAIVGIVIAIESLDQIEFLEIVFQGNTTNAPEHLLEDATFHVWLLEFVEVIASLTTLAVTTR